MGDGKKLFGCGCSLLAAVVAVVVAAASVAGFAMYRLMQGSGSEFDGPATAFDPLLNLPRAKELAGPGAQLIKLSAEHVRADGTIDLTGEHAGSAQYTFLGGASEAPLGTTNATSMMITVHVSEPGWSKTSYDGRGMYKMGYTPGMRRSETPMPPNPFLQPVTVPACSFADLWKKALAGGAPANAVASIDYRSKPGIKSKSAVYEFEVPGSGFAVDFTEDCKPAS